MNLLLGKTVLITGASSGIGKATALEYAKNGTNLILCARRTEKLLELERKIKIDFPNVRVLPLTLDVRYRKTVFDQIKSLPNSFKNIDILVNNAGLVKGMDYVADVPMEKIDVMFDTNVKGLINVTQAVLPGMKERNSGMIVNINSIAGTETYPGGGGYCGSKHAVTAITKSLRHELVSTPINVISIEPGMVETEFSIVRFDGDKDRADAIYKGFKPLTGKDIAETICFATSRNPNVQIASIVIFPTNQSSVTNVFRK